MLPTWRLFHTQRGDFSGGVRGDTRTQGFSRFLLRSRSHLRAFYTPWNYFLTSFPNVEFSWPCVAYLNKRQCNWHLAEKCEWLVKGGRKWRRQQEQRWAKKEWGRCLFFFLFGWPILWGFRFSLPSGSQRTERVSPKCVCVCVCVCLPVYFRFHLSLTGRFVLRPSASKLCNLAHEMYFLLPSF